MITSPGAAAFALAALDMVNAGTSRFTVTDEGGEVTGLPLLSFPEPVAVLVTDPAVTLALVVM